MEQYDVIVIGGGPGGYVAAVRCTQLGMKTALVEKEHLGGTCLNWGCIPTKALLRNAEVVHLLSSKGRTYGFSFDNLAVDYAAAHKRSRTVVTRQTKRIAILMKKSGVTVYDGTARFRNSREIEIAPEGTTISAKHFIIATGAKPRSLPGTDFDGERIINYRKALDLKQVPDSALIVGAGPIGMEFATVWNRYGCQVTVVELLDHALPLEDADISIEAEKQFKRNRITIKTGALVEQALPGADGVEVTIAKGDAKETMTVATVLVSIGIVPNSEGLGLEEAGVSTERGNIVIDDQMCTNVPHIYAIGDVTGKMALAHVASAQGMIAAEASAGRSTEKIHYPNVPRCTYASPEVASVGLTEQQARDQGYEVTTAQCPFAANGKAMAMDDNTGFVKIVADKNKATLLGVHLVGGHVTELVAGPTGMITLKSDMADIGRTIHPHPTLSESLMEAAHKLCGHAIHI